MDDDTDNTTDEGRLEVVGSSLTLSTDSPAARVGVAPSAAGFHVVFSAYCLESGDGSTEVYVNHVGTDGTLAVNSGPSPCAAMKGKRIFTSTGKASRMPAISSDGNTRAGVVWTEQTTGDAAELRVAEIEYNSANATEPIAINAVSSAGAIESALYGNTAAFGGIAKSGSTYATGRTQGVGVDERAYAQRVTRNGSTMTVASNVELRTSTEGEVALGAYAGANNGFVAAWTDAQTLYAYALTDAGQLVNTWRTLDRGAHAPVESVVIPISVDRVIIAFHEQTNTNIQHVRFAAFNRGDTIMQLASGALASPLRKGFFGAAHAGSDEVIVAYVDEVSGYLQARRVNSRTGTTCGTALTLTTASDVGNVAVAVKGDMALVVWRTGPDTDTEPSTIHAVRVRRIN